MTLVRERNRFTHARWLLAAILALIPCSAADAQDAPKKRPNIIVILADDIGYGDLGCYGATKVKTPHLDRLAASGLRFTDGHSASATCTPSRYALLTGQYAWRHKAGSGILPGDAPLCIPTDRMTLPRLLQMAGYRTGVVGKWHLGLGDGKLDYNTEIKPGPREIGFDYSFLIPATGDRVPTVYVENQKVVGLDPNDPIKISYKEKVGNEPTGKENPEQLKMKLSLGHNMTIVNGISRIGWMSGGKNARWNDETMADDIAKKAIEFIESSKKEPFFLYFATHDIHVPRVPHPRFQKSSECGVRGDVIQQADDTVGQIMAALERLKIADDTIVIFSSDNGPVIDDGYADGAQRDLNGHRPAGHWRGGKYSLFEGGHRVPFIVRWPGTTKPGQTDQTVCQVDLMAALANIAGAKLPNDAAPDSFDISPILTGAAKGPIRDHLVYHTRPTALRKGPWVLIPADAAKNKKGKQSPTALYNLASDPGQQQNVAANHPAIVAEMSAMLTQIHNNGRSRP